MFTANQTETLLSGTLAAGASASAVGGVTYRYASYGGNGLSRYTRVREATITNNVAWPSMPNIEDMSTAGIKGQANSSTRIAQSVSVSLMQSGWDPLMLSQASGYAQTNADNIGNGSAVTFTMSGRTYDLYVQTGVFMQAGM